MLSGFGTYTTFRSKFAELKTKSAQQTLAALAISTTRRPLPFINQAPPWQ
jgi:hypothetical protein